MIRADDEARAAMGGELHGIADARGAVTAGMRAGAQAGLDRVPARA